MSLNTFDWVGIGQDKNSSDMVGVDCSGFAWVGMIGMGWIMMERAEMGFQKWVWSGLACPTRPTSTLQGFEGMRVEGVEQNPYRRVREV